MRKFLGVVFGLLFILLGVIFLLLFNLKLTLLSPEYVKNIARESGLYQNIPQFANQYILDMETEGGFLGEEDILSDSIKASLSPEITKPHLESMIDQLYSTDTVLVDEDISDINKIIISKVKQDFGFEASSDSFIFPDSIKFEKNFNDSFFFNRYLIYASYITWGLAILSVIFLISLFFVSDLNYKIRLKWMGSFLLTASIVVLVPTLALCIFKWDTISRLFPIPEGLPSLINKQIESVYSLINRRLFTLYLYEFVILLVISVVIFFIASIIKKGARQNG